MPKSRLPNPALEQGRLEVTRKYESLLKKIRQRIEEQKKRKGLSYAKIARKGGLRPKQLTDFMWGYHANVQLQTLIALSVGTGIPLNRLLS